ncbi:MAG: DinB family protein [Chloroflexota bacterium]
MLTDKQSAKLDVIRKFPNALETAVANLTEEQLDAFPIDDEWSVRQIVHHCADSHMNSIVRLKLILTEDNPPLKPYAEALWAKTADVTDVPISASLTLLKGLHQRWVVLFGSLTADQWQRTGFHSDLKKQLTPNDLLDIYERHCTAHLEQIERTIAALGE